jgi:hypothetical protein
MGKSVFGDDFLQPRLTACAPNAKPAPWNFDAGVHTNVDAE